MNKFVLVAGYIFIALMIAGSCLGTYYFYSKYKKTNADYQELKSKYNDLIEHPEQLAKSEADLYLEKVKKLTDVPSSETPEIQTILDISQLKDQEFFKDAANGDKILVFKEAKQAIIFRPSTNQIVNSGPLITVSK